MTEIVIVNCARTPIGAFQGELASVTAPMLGSYAIKSVIEKSHVDKNTIDEVIMGLVLSAGLGQAPARQAAINSGLAQNIGATTINKMCGSGMKAIMLAHDLILSGNANLIVAGGMESMSNAPYLLPKARRGYRMGHNITQDHMFLDGLEDAYEKGTLMGVYAEKTATKYNISRKTQDDFAIESLKRAQTAHENKHYDFELHSITLKTRKGEKIISQDETPANANFKKIPQLKPAFAKDGTVTAANSSSISDGAAACIITSAEYAKNNSLQPIAKIIAHQSHAQQPEWFTTAPVGAIKKVLDKATWKVEDVDLFEINEAFAVVTLAAMQELNIPHNKVNIHGGACALGHPIGASGARIISTLIGALQATNTTKGVAALCIGGGEATAIALELI